MSGKADPGRKGQVILELRKVIKWRTKKKTEDGKALAVLRGGWGGKHQVREQLTFMMWTSRMCKDMGLTWVA